MMSYVLTDYYNNLSVIHLSYSGLRSGQLPDVLTM